MKESLEKQDEASSTYAFMSSSSNQNYSTNKQASKEITIENLMQNINT